TPGGLSNPQLQFQFTASGKSKSRPSFIREARSLCTRQTFLCPDQRGGDKKVYVECIVVVKVDRITILGVVFHTGTSTTPKRVRGSAIEFEIARAGWLKISHHAGIRVLRCENAVV